MKYAGCNSAVECLLPKQGVTSSNLATRSIVPKGGSCLTPRSVPFFLVRYQVAARAAGLSQSTIRHTTNSLTYFARHVGLDTDVQRIGVDEFRTFLAALRDQNVWAGTPKVKPRLLSPTTINTYARAIRAFWSWLKREGIIRKNVLQEVPAPRLPRRLPRAFGETEVRQILQSASGQPRDIAMVQLLVDSGIRLSELVGLALPDIDLKLGRLRVYGKGGKERYAYISKTHCYVNRGLSRKSTATAPDGGPAISELGWHADKRPTRR